jgi:hemerythrin superfamily protein
MAPRLVPQNPPGTNGLKRDSALVPLSRDHQFVLLQARALRRAASSDDPREVRAASEAYLTFFREELLPHATDEEEVVLPRTRHLDPEGVERIVTEHREIGDQFRRLEAAVDAGEDARPLLAEIASLLDDHVRFEERSFFMRVQEALLPEALGRLREALERRRRERGLAGPACRL